MFKLAEEDGEIYAGSILAEFVSERDRSAEKHHYWDLSVQDFLERFPEKARKLLSKYTIDPRTKQLLGI